MRVGHGYDVHALVNDRPLVIGGVDIPYEFGLAGHSDADVLTHAICDACLGAAGAGDIGQHFPDTDPNYKDIDSRVLLENVLQLIRKRNLNVANLDATIIAQKPRLAPYITEMRNSLSATLGLPVDKINIKAKTNELLGWLGRGEGIAAHAIVLLDDA